MLGLKRQGLSEDQIITLRAEHRLSTPSRNPDHQFRRFVGAIALQPQAPFEEIRKPHSYTETKGLTDLRAIPVINEILEVTQGHDGTQCLDRSFSTFAAAASPLDAYSMRNRDGVAKTRKRSVAMPHLVLSEFPMQPPPPSTRVFADARRSPDKTLLRFFRCDMMFDGQKDN